MSLVGDALELMFSAHMRARTIRAVVREETNLEVWNKSAGRWAELAPNRRLTTATGFEFTRIGPETPNTTEPPRTEVQTRRIWRRQPGWHWRIEAGHPSDPQVTIVVDDKYWSREPGQPFITNVGADGQPNSGGLSFSSDKVLAVLFDPAPLLPILAISEAVADTVLDRPVIRLRYREWT